MQLVDLDERETAALVTLLSYMVRSGYRMAPTLIEDYANNILQNNDPTRSRKVKASYIDKLIREHPEYIYPQNSR